MNLPYAGGMLKKILIPLDGSDLSETVLPCAIGLARRHHCESILLQVVPHLAEVAPGLAPELLPELQLRSLTRGQNYLEDRASQFAPLPVSAIVRLGSPREEIPALAARHQCGLIVMASHGREGVEHWLLGSVAEGVLRQAPCPVLLVRPPVQAVSSFQHILVPTDGSEASLAVLNALPGFLAEGGKVTLLQSSGVSLVPNFADKSLVVSKYLDEVEARLREVKHAELPLEVVVLDGDPVEDILVWSKANHCDLIAMSSHGRSGFRRLWLGSVSEKVARHADCGVLIFPPATSG